jgi:type VII secretion-associated serine protease mycosin
MKVRALAGAVVALALVAATASPALADSIRDRQWQLNDLNIREVHRLTSGEGAIVALIDTGVADHRDLSGAVLPGIDTMAGGNEEAVRKDLDGHGTEMAGIIAGRGHGSGDGVLGIAPAAKILPINAPINAGGSSSFMTKAVDFAIAKHAGVINMSFGTQGSDTMLDAIHKAQAADIVVVASSGNRGDENIEYPGAYTEVLTVGGYAKDRKIGSFSVTGPQVDLTAPGEEIATTGSRGGGYRSSTGTSGAAAIVSAAAALVRAKYPELSAAEVVHRLTATADDAGSPGRDDTYGFGRLNLLKALVADVAPLPATSAGADTASSEPAAAGPTSAVDINDVPEANNPLILAVAAAAVVVVLAAVIALVVVLRRRRAY